MVRSNYKSKGQQSGRQRTRFHRNVKKIFNERQQNVRRLIYEDLNCTHEATLTSVADSNRIDENELRDNLAKWVNENRIAKRAVNSLLSILNSAGFDSLPKDYRTLLKTPTDVQITNTGGGEYWYNGLKNNLETMFASLDRDIAIELKFNVDGLPLFHSSKMTFYPILASIHGEYSQNFRICQLNSINSII